MCQKGNYRLDNVSVHPSWSLVYKSENLLYLETSNLQVELCAKFFNILQASKQRNKSPHIRMAQAHLYLVLSVAIVMVFLASHSDACFITNCPPAGKRSVMPALLSSRLHREVSFALLFPLILTILPFMQCTRCGPALSGRCFGPNICCSPMSGCSVGGAMAARCALEAYSPQLCSNPGQTCAANGKGVCALNSTCCTSGNYHLQCRSNA